MCIQSAAMNRVLGEGPYSTYRNEIITEMDVFSLFV